MKTLQTEITIKASEKEVWRQLMTHEDYPSWNPFIAHLSGSTKEGDSIVVKIKPEGKDPMTFNPLVLRNEKNKEFRWLGKLFIKGLFDGEHFFLIEKISSTETRFIHGEHFRGLLAGIFMNQIGESTLRGFKAMNEALKNRVETNTNSI